MAIAGLMRETDRLRHGTLVSPVTFRHPATVARMAATIDEMSGGRVEFGLGTGWYEAEHTAYGIPFPEIKVRMDQLEESIQCVRGLLHDDVTSFSGEWFSMKEARNEPRPVQKKLPIWVGGGGEKRTLKIAAKYADAWNVPFISPEAFAQKRAVLHEHCESIGRNPAELACAVNLGIAWTEESLRSQFGGVIFLFDLR